MTILQNVKFMECVKLETDTVLFSTPDCHPTYLIIRSTFIAESTVFTVYVFTSMV